MKVSRVVWWAAFALLLLSGRTVMAQDPDLAAIEEAMAPFEEVQAALDAGYAPQFGCIMHPTDGAMGVHYINGDLFADPAIDALQPESVIYEPQEDGTLEAVGLEYIVLQEAWHAAGHEGPPSLLGQDFMPVTGFFEVPPFYALHLWLWRENPAGIFVSYNAAVACPEGEGVVPPNVAHPMTMPQTGASSHGGGVAPELWLAAILLLAGALLSALLGLRRARV